MLAGTAGIYKSSSVHDGPIPPVNITEQAWKYVNAMRGSQDPKGWLGPTDNPKDGNTYVPSPVPARAHAVPQARGLGLRAI